MLFRSVELIDKILESRDRSQAGPTAAARGLCLQWVHYDLTRDYPPPQEEISFPMNMSRGDAESTEQEENRMDEMNLF